MKDKPNEKMGYCPFMPHHYGAPFLFLILFGFGNINIKERRCIGGKCAVYDEVHGQCSLKTYAKVS